MKIIQMSQAKAKTAPIPIATVSMPYPHLTTVFTPEDDVDDEELPGGCVWLGELDVLTCVIVEVVVVELEVELK
jgi:hypothetical protein